MQSSSPLPHYGVFTVDFDESLVEQIDRSTLPSDWRSSPPPSAVQQIGDKWVHSASSAVLEVPSALIPHERNYLLNPSHPTFARVVVSDRMPFDVDPRVFK